MNAANRQSTRWLTLIGTIITQFALGSVYTRSLFNSSLSDKLGEPVSGRLLLWPAEPRAGALLVGRRQAAGAFRREARHHGLRDPARTGLLPDRALQQPDDAVAERGRAGGAGGRRRLSADPVELREVVPGTQRADFRLLHRFLWSRQLGFKFIDTHLLATVGLEKPSSSGALSCW